jgi:hypothetical protein
MSAVNRGSPVIGSEKAVMVNKQISSLNSPFLFRESTNYNPGSNVLQKELFFL